jgi:hypothetical protein
MHTPNPSMTTLDFDHHYESVVVRIVMRGIRRGHIDPAPEHLQRWTDREVACGLRPA